jgi:acyl-CoA synthetase (AMP-forming)/AMP-acid ligase II
MPDLLTARAAKQPDKLAVVDGRGLGGVRSLTSAQLETRSDQLALPRSISWLDELPKTGSGKVLERELRQPFWAEHGSNV